MWKYGNGICRYGRVYICLSDKGIRIYSVGVVSLYNRGKGKEKEDGAGVGESMCWCGMVWIESIYFGLWCGYICLFRNGSFTGCL